MVAARPGAALRWINGEVRALLASDEPASRAAVDLFAHRVTENLGALATALGGPWRPAPARRSPAR